MDIQHVARLVLKNESYKLNCIELFAGAGGLTLGLKSINAKLIFANELSPMAAQTFAYNFFSETLDQNINPINTLWLYSAHPKEKMSLRLKENLKEFKTENDKTYSDITPETDLNNKLLVGSIVELNNLLDREPQLLDKLPPIDLVSGGPPCQSFSMAGLRDLKNDRNSLPWEFVRFINKTKPKFALLENVSGILRPFNTKHGKFYAWYEISKAFAITGYVPICLHVNAKYAGVAQNRPRFILIAIREDLVDKILKNLSHEEQQIIINSSIFRDKVLKTKDIEYGHLNILDIEKNPEIFQTNLLCSLIKNHKNVVPVRDAIDDLSISQPNQISNHVLNVNKQFKHCLQPQKTICNQNIITSSGVVQARIRVYQIISLMDKSTQKEVSSYLKGMLNDLSESTKAQLLQHEFLLTNLTTVKLKTSQHLIELMNEIKSKKQSQKALIASLPAPTALCVPVDNTHYKDTRILSVREMARIQSFPDSFIFLSKVDTGGVARRFEIPQYAQVGNAVPPLLANALGICIKKLINCLADELCETANENLYHKVSCN